MNSWDFAWIGRRPAVEYIVAHCEHCAWVASHQKPATDAAIVEAVQFLRRQLIQHCLDAHAETLSLAKGKITIPNVDNQGGSQ